MLPKLSKSKEVSEVTPQSLLTKSSNLHSYLRA